MTCRGQGKQVIKTTKGNPKTDIKKPIDRGVDGSLAFRSRLVHLPFGKMATGRWRSAFNWSVEMKISKWDHVALRC